MRNAREIRSSGRFVRVRTRPARGGAALARPEASGLLPVLVAVLLAAAASGCAGARAEAGDAAAEADVPVDPQRIQAALFASNELVEPSRGRRVTYDTDARVVRIVFTTPPDFVVDFRRFWERWRLNQWRVLAQMDRSGVPVEAVVVETNHTDGSGRVRVTSSADLVRAAARTSPDAWRRGSRIEQRLAGTPGWELVEPTGGP